MKETQQGNLLRPTQPLGVSKINYPRSPLTYSSMQGKWLPRSLNIEYLQLYQNFANVTIVSSGKHDSWKIQNLLFLPFQSNPTTICGRLQNDFRVLWVWITYPLRLWARLSCVFIFGLKAGKLLLGYICTFYIWLLALKIANFVQNKMYSCI